MENLIKMDDLGYPYFRKHSYLDDIFWERGGWFKHLEIKGSRHFSDFFRWKFSSSRYTGDDSADRIEDILYSFLGEGVHSGKLT